MMDLKFLPPPSKTEGSKVIDYESIFQNIASFLPNT